MFKSMFKPRDEEILMWDPERMDKYWQQCEVFDYYPEIKDKNKESEEQFQVMLLTPPCSS